MTGVPEGLVDRIVSLHESCIRAVRISRMMSKEDLLKKEINQLALSKAIEVIGEIAAGIVRRYPAYVDERPELRLREATALRHRLVHGYETISFDRLWDTVEREIPALRDALEPILSDAGESLT